MTWFVNAFRQNPELAIFLTLALGFLIGKVKIGGFSFGTVVGTLLAGVLVGQLNIQVPAIVKTVFFDLFLFTTGYKVGPQFFRGLKKDAVSQVAGHGRAVRHVSRGRLRRREGPRVRHRDRGGSPGRGVLRVYGHRDRRRRHQSPGDLGRGEGAPRQQHSRRLCGHVPGWDGRARLVPSHDWAQAHGGQPPGRGQEDAAAGTGALGGGARCHLGGPPIRRPGLPRDERCPREQDGRRARERCPRTSGSSSCGSVGRAPSSSRADHGDPPGRRRGGGGAPRGPRRARKPRSVRKSRTASCSTSRSRCWTWWSRTRRMTGKSLAELAKPRVRPRGLPAEARTGRRGDAGRPRDAQSTGVT